MQRLLLSHWIIGSRLVRGSASSLRSKLLHLVFRTGPRASATVAAQSSRHPVPRPPAARTAPPARAAAAGRCPGGSAATATTGHCPPRGALPVPFPAPTRATWPPWRAPWQAPWPAPSAWPRWHRRSPAAAPREVGREELRWGPPRSPTC